ncbi:MAG: hypothetical protein ABII06_01475 [Pseudomonadota bacterium]
MNRGGKILTMAAMLFWSLCLYPVSSWAQPLGFLSSQPKQKSEQQILCSDNGRFVFGQVSESSKDKFMLDTHTGRLWRIAESGGIGIYLTPVTYRTGEGAYAPVPGEISEGDVKGTEKK